MHVWHLNEHILKVLQTFACVGDYSKKPVNENTIVPQDSKRGWHENGQLRIIKFKYLTMQVGREKCQFQHVLPHQEK